MKAMWQGLRGRAGGLALHVGRCCGRVRQLALQLTALNGSYASVPMSCSAESSFEINQDGATFAGYELVAASSTVAITVSRAGSPISQESLVAGKIARPTGDVWLGVAAR